MAVGTPLPTFQDTGDLVRTLNALVRTLEIRLTAIEFRLTTLEQSTFTGTGAGEFAIGEHP